MAMERRTNTRVPFTIDAVIRYRDRPINGSLLNISLRGICIDIPEMLPLHAMADVEIILEAGSKRMNLFLPCEVIRSELGGTAVRLRNMNVESYIALRDIVMDNAQNPETIMDEFRSFLSENPPYE
jgi:hypothetical protein